MATSMPRCDSARAATRPPIPPPMIATRVIQSATPVARSSLVSGEILRLDACAEPVGQEYQAVTDGGAVDEAHGLPDARLTEQAYTGSEHDRKDDQPQLVDQVMLDQRAYELIARVHDDFSTQLPLEL